MMMTASLWLMEMLTPSGCTLLTTKLIVKFSAGSGSLSSTITILKQPLLFPNKTVALTISKSFSALVSEIKRKEGWKTYGYILLLQVNMNYFRGTYSLNYLNRHLKTIFFLLNIFDQVYINLSMKKTCHIRICGNRGWSCYKGFSSCIALYYKVVYCNLP